MKVFCDMDGVLADFDRHHDTHFGYRPDKKADDVDWDKVRAIPFFFERIPPMYDAHYLWEAILPRKPIILTGVPTKLVGTADNEKVRWIRRWAGPDVEVRCVKSKDKCLHCQPGDVLIDDWEKYRHMWEGAGGVWVTHTSAVKTIAQLRHLGVV